MSHFKILLLLACFWGQPMTADAFNGNRNIEGLTQDALIINGCGTLKKTKITHDLTINGAGSVEESEVGGSLQVNGALDLKDVATVSLNVNGAVSADRVKVSGKTSIYGAFEAKNSHFQEIEAHTTLVILENCVVDDITVSKDMKNDQQVVELKGESKIQRLKFESGRGIVKKEANVILEHVDGGKIE